MSQNSLVMTVLGRDRPGLVESLARVVSDHGGNWVESRMAHLAGQFAGIVRVEVDADRAEPLADALRGLGEQGLALVIHPDSSQGARPPQEEGLVLLELVGQDRPGIVREITCVLAANGVNVEELRTECVTAPTTGQPLFQATAKLQLPPAVSESQLRRELERITGDLMVDFTIR